VIYLASPYSHQQAQIREQRYRDACQATAALLRAGQNVFSPIVHGHPLTAYGLPTDWQYWEAFDRELISCCNELYVLTIDGWQESVGVTAETMIATELDRPIRYACLNGVELT
jgi:hypothetical protein